MDIVTLVCCGVNLVLLVILLIKAFGKKTDDKGITELRNQLEVLKQTSSADNSRLMEQSARQGESVVNQIIKLGENLAGSQDRQQTRTAEILDKISTEMNGLRRENQQSLEKINTVVTEKMQKTLDEKLNGAFETVVQNMAQITESTPKRKMPLPMIFPALSPIFAPIISPTNTVTPIESPVITSVRVSII